MTAVSWVTGKDSWLQRAAGLLLLVMLAGCQGTGDQQPTRANDQAQTQSRDRLSGLLPDGSIRYDTEDSRVAELWAKAEAARRSGQSQQAIDALVEALEVEPMNGLLWSRAAEVQLDMNEPALAENYAVKSNLFSADNRVLLLRNWLIIEHARKRRGDLLGMRTAQQKIRQYQYQ